MLDCSRIGVTRGTAAIAAIAAALRHSLCQSNPSHLFLFTEIWLGARADEPAADRDGSNNRHANVEARFHFSRLAH